MNKNLIYKVFSMALAFLVLLSTFSFNNFSTRNIFNKKAYKPLPMGDGQTLSLRLQKSRYYTTSSFSFTEPWLGGKKPRSLSFSIFYNTSGSLSKKC